MSDSEKSFVDMFTAEQEEAARVIQRAFRRILDMNVFQFYKNLISFRGKGDPRLLLKCVNPREAELIDAAAGVHVRFRLGGTEFPPNIYYKLFTHRPIVDMCSNSPKDYTQDCLKQLLPKQRHNRGPVPKQDLSGWYTRVENNGWRLLTPRNQWLQQNIPRNRIPVYLFKSGSMIFFPAAGLGNSKGDVKVSHSLDLVTAANNRNRIPFHHSKLQRKQDVEKRQKKRKIEWMKKMYYEGSLHAETTDPEIALLVRQATEGVIQTAEEHGANSVMDWEVDELLNWTNALSYEEYISSWKEIGTSKSSCAFKGSSFIQSPYDHYEFSQIRSPASTDLSLVTEGQ